MKCVNCSAELAQGARFCSRCGTSIAARADAPAVATASATSAAQAQPAVPVSPAERTQVSPATQTQPAPNAPAAPVFATGAGPVLTAPAVKAPAKKIGPLAVWQIAVATLLNVPGGLFALYFAKQSDKRQADAAGSAKCARACFFLACALGLAAAGYITVSMLG